MSARDHDVRVRGARLTEPPLRTPLRGAGPLLFHWRLAILMPFLVLFPVAPGAAAAMSSEPAQTQERVAQMEGRLAALEAMFQQLRADYEERIAGLQQQVLGLQADLSLRDTATPETEPETAVAAEPESLEAALARALAELGSEPEASDIGTEQVADKRQFDDRARNLSAMNPEISVTGDMFGSTNGRSGDPTTNQFQINEFEAAFQSALDPFSEAKAFLVFEDGEFDLEEMYVNWTTLPAGLGLKAGRFRNDFGKLNRWHQHALQQTDRPAVHRALFGEEGLVGLGVSLSWLPAPFLGDYNEFWVQVTNDENDVMFSGRGFDQPVFTLHETNYWDLSASTYFELGLSASTGVNDENGEHRTWVYGADVNLNWSPAAEARYKGFEFRGEVLYERRGGADGTRGTWGGYLYGTRKLGLQWSVGLRGDWTQLPLEPGEEVWGLTPYVEWWQSEWARLRLQYSYNSRGIEDPKQDNRFFIQVTWAIGPHKHEKY